MKMMRVSRFVSALYKDQLPGGLADNFTDKDFPSDALSEGIEVELEHTDDRKLAREIAMDHLVEDLDYYKKLKVMESE